MLTSSEIRQGFVDFFVKNGHTFVPSSAVVPQDDPTLLFTNAGMNQFKNIFLGAAKPGYTRAANSQKCIRVSGKHNDLEEVGKDTYHHTFFEMLGNWSFGDYFKKEAITWAWELLTKVWGLNPNQLWASVFGGDQADGVPMDSEAEEYWQKYTGIPAERVLRFGRKENFWEMGDTGPCGPCSEIHIDLGPERCDKPHIKHVCRVNGECARYIELWNLVFIQYNRDEKGVLHELPAKHVDTGAGLERVVAVMQNKRSNYDTDLFSPIMDRIGSLSGKKYTSILGDEKDNAFRVIADHIRALTFSIADGALPGNEGRGYVLRRILRRATRFGLLLDLHEPFLHKIVPALVDTMGQVYPEIASRAQHVQNVLEAEEAGFRKTLERGIEIFEADAKEMAKSGAKELPGEKAFRLYDTYGFPLDLTQLLAAERGLTVDVAGFNKNMAVQREQARAAQKNVTYKADVLSQVLPPTQDQDKYYSDNLTARVIGFVIGEEYRKEGAIPPNERVGLVLDRTCAYAESGGQVGDKGTIWYNGSVFAFEETVRIGPAVVHFGLTEEETLEVGHEVTIKVDPARDDTRRNHTATHLMQWALQQVLGSHAHQQGSLVNPDYLRFDFTHPKALTPDELRQVEKLVNDKITESQPVVFQTLPIEQARKLGAMALFSEKYGEQVRVLAIGTSNPKELELAFSREFCGGTHVANTRDIGGFKITREESVASGVRRITALTGRALNSLLFLRHEQVEELAHLMKATPEQLVDRVKSLIEENKKLKKQMQKGAAGDLKSVSQELLDSAAHLGEAVVVVGEIPEGPVEAVRGQIDWFRSKAPTGVVVLGQKQEEGKVMLFAAVTDNLTKKISAGEIVKTIAPLVGGGGGGRPNMAQAGGKDAEKLAEALDKAREYIKSKLG